jgi:hypothetical protein
MANKRQPPDETGFRAENDIDEVLGYANPNPERAGCPARDVLVAAANREIPADHPVHRHLIKCSPCYREVRGLQQAAGERRFISAPRNWWPAAGAAAAVVIIGVVVWLVVGRQDGVAPPPSGSPVLSVQVDLRKHVMLRSEQKADAPPLSLPRGHLDLSLVLPSGSEPGEYEVQILDSSLTSRVSTTGAAEMREFMTVLDITIDTGALSPGTYELAVRQQDADWRVFPLRIE